MIFSSQRRFNISLVVFSALALLISLFAQFGFKYAPCFLCNLQRAGFVALGVVAFHNLKHPSLRFLKHLVWFTCLFGCLVSGYHFLVQQGLVKDFCAVHSPIQEDLFDNIILSNWGRASCASKSWTLFGAPASLFAMVGFSVLGACGLAASRRAKKQLLG